MGSIAGRFVLLVSLLLLCVAPARPQGRIDLRTESGCSVGSEETAAILALADRISDLWETGEAETLAGLFWRGGISTPERPRIELGSEIEAAISEQSSRPIFQGSRLEVVLRCLREEPGASGVVAVEGNWRLSRFYGQESAAGGSPMPSHLMPPTSGGFVAQLIERDGRWFLGDLSLAFDSPS